MAAKKKTTKKKTPPAPTNPSSGKTLLPSDPSLTAQERAAVTAVQEYITAEKAIQIFKEEYAPLMEQLRELTEELDAKWEQADQLVRGLDATCGPWVRFTEDVRYDPSALYESVGKAKFLEYGGTISTVEAYELDKDRIAQAIKTGAIPKHVVDAFRKVIPKYRTPK